MNIQPLSQYDNRWRHRLFPNAMPNTPKLSWNNFGCWATCLCMIFGIDPNEMMDKNPDCWVRDGNLKTDMMLNRYKHGMRKVYTQTLPELGKPIVAVTSYYKQRGADGKLLSGFPYSFPTHFFIYLGNGMIMDPASKPENVGPKPIGKYAPYITEYRVLEKL